MWESTRAPTQGLHPTGRQDAALCRRDPNQHATAVAAKFPGVLRNNIWDCMRRALSDWFPRGPSPGTPHTILLD